MFLIGVWRVLWGLSLIPAIVHCRTLDFGGYISERTVLNATDSIYEVRKDVIIEKDAILIIKPGVELRFAPGVGIYVHRDGILEAKVSSIFNFYSFFITKTKKKISCQVTLNIFLPRYNKYIYYILPRYNKYIYGK